MTAHLQPLDAGIIANFKLKYRAQHLAQIIYQFDSGGQQSKLSMRQAIDFTVNAWERVEEKTISNNWKATGILPCEETSTILKDLED
ncbi:Tigger transposable element-derived protein 6, partial [Mortierella sp. AD094]